MQRSITTRHKNDLATYLGDWLNMIRMLRPNDARSYRRRLPTTFEALHDNAYDLSVVLAHLDSRLRTLEEHPLADWDWQAYGEARVFLKAFYVFFCILLDNIAAIVEFFYKKNEPNVPIPKSFHDLLQRADKNRLPLPLSTLLQPATSWFPEVKDARDDLIHHYDALIVSIKRGAGGDNILGHFNIKGRGRRQYASIREHLGYLLCQYQLLVDSLLDHLDSKFSDWYTIAQGTPSRSLTHRVGPAALPLWWAYEYGNYRHKDLLLH